MSSFIGNGLKSHGVCVELLVTVISSALAIAPFVTDDAVELRISLIVVVDFCETFFVCRFKHARKKIQNRSENEQMAWKLFV